MKPDFWQRFSLAGIRDRMPGWMKNRYVLTILVFLLWLILLDPNNLISRVREIQTRNRLEREKEYYMTRIEEDRRKLNELRTSNENLEKYAREQYRMKKPDEDLFIIVTPEQERRIRRDRKVSETAKPQGKSQGTAKSATKASEKAKSSREASKKAKAATNASEKAKASREASEKAKSATKASEIKKPAKQRAPESSGN